MRRLHALGTAFLFLATLGLAVSAAADPINIESGVYVQSSSKPAALTLSGNGFAYMGRDRDVDAPEIESERQGSYHLNGRFDDDFPVSSGMVKGIALNNLWLDGRFNVASASFTPSASGNSVPFQYTANVSGYGYSSEPARGEQVFAGQLQGSGVAQVSYAQSGGKLMPTSVTYSFGGASSVVTPEPASMLLLGSGLGLAALRSRLRKKRA
jgi:hypothetical protein